MEEFSVEKHKKALRAMNERILKGENVDVQKEISHLLGEDNWLFKLKNYLTRAVNAQISYKMKDRYNNERMYFELRNKIENGIIADTSWYGYFQSIDLTELQNTTVDDSIIHNATLMLVVSKGCRDYIDVGEESTDKAKALHNLYLKLKETLSSNIPFPVGDGYIDYLKTKQQRIDLEDTRISGKICPFCESTDVKSFGANWKCRTCGREFRKHRRPTED